MSRNRRVGVLDVSDAISAMFVTYGQDVNEVIDDALTVIGGVATKKLQAVNKWSGTKWNYVPTGKYSKDWEFGFYPEKRLVRKVVVYNADHYRLTHLLESGHAKFLWGVNTGGEVQGYPHIAPVNNEVQEKFINEVVERITDLRTV